MKIFSKSGYIPQYATPGSAGLDLPFWDETKEQVSLAPGEEMKLSTGLHFEIDKGYVGFIDTRSSTSKLKLTLGCRTIDSDYRGEVKVCMINVGQETQVISRGRTLVHMLILPVAQPEIVAVSNLEEFSKTERGDGGFGSTGATRG